MDLDLNPRLAALSEAEKAEYQATIAKASPVEKLIIKELVWQGMQLTQHTAKCVNACEARFRRLERLRVLIYGAIGIVPPVAALVWWLSGMLGKGPKP